MKRPVVFLMLAAIAVAVVIVVVVIETGSASTELKLGVNNSFTINASGIGSTWSGDSTVSAELDGSLFSGTATSLKTVVPEDSGKLTGTYLGKQLQLTSTGWNCSVTAGCEQSEGGVLSVHGSWGGMSISGTCSRSGSSASDPPNLVTTCSGMLGSVPVTIDVAALSFGASSWSVDGTYGGIEYEGSGSTQNRPSGAGLSSVTGSFSRH
jgi:hypothetical protein